MRTSLSDIRGCGPRISGVLLSLRQTPALLGRATLPTSHEEEPHADARRGERRDPARDDHAHVRPGGLDEPAHERTADRLPAEQHEDVQRHHPTADRHVGRQLDEGVRRRDEEEVRDPARDEQEGEGEEHGHRAGGRLQDADRRRRDDHDAQVHTPTPRRRERPGQRTDGDEGVEEPVAARADVEDVRGVGGQQDRQVEREHRHERDHDDRPPDGRLPHGVAEPLLELALRLRDDRGRDEFRDTHERQGEHDAGAGEGVDREGPSGTDGGDEDTADGRADEPTELEDGGVEADGVPEFSRGPTSSLTNTCLAGLSTTVTRPSMKAMT